MRVYKLSCPTEFDYYLKHKTAIVSTNDLQLAYHQGDFDAGYLYECEFPSSGKGEEDKEEAVTEVVPRKAVPVPDSNDVPICTIMWR